jgi:NAD(P)-dependent dehydrogenase (short-subunit alcohol dehydrogenase family)
MPACVGSPFPFLGMYCASKFALEGFTEAFRHEVKPFNIRVLWTEAGFLKTPMMNNRRIAANRITEYDLWRQRAPDATRAYVEKGPGAGGQNVARDHVQQYVATTLPDWAASEVRHPFTAISPGRNVRTGSAARLLTG